VHYNIPTYLLILTYLPVVDDDDVQQSLHTDSLNIMTDDEPALVGSMCGRVSMRTELRGRPTLVVRVESFGKISGSQCGTVITARLSMRLDTLEQHVQEFVKVRLTITYYRRLEVHRESEKKQQQRSLFVMTLANVDRF